MRINGEGDPLTLDPVRLRTNFAPGELPPYGEVLSGILGDDPTLSVRADEVEECWRIVTPVLAAWKNNEVPIDEYPVGSAGPTSWTPSAGSGLTRPGAVRWRRAGGAAGQSSGSAGSTGRWWSRPASPRFQ